MEERNGESKTIQRAIWAVEWQDFPVERLRHEERSGAVMGRGLRSRWL